MNPHGNPATLRPFQKGVSPNPGGRPKASALIAALARENCVEAFQKIVELIRHPNAKVALAAAQEVLNRALGKPSQAIEITGDTRRFVVQLPLQCNKSQEWIQTIEVPTQTTQKALEQKS